jgi:hypothetical protein
LSVSSSSASSSSRLLWWWHEESPLVLCRNRVYHLFTQTEEKEVMVTCHHCGKMILNGSIRWVKLGNGTYPFCTPTNATVAPDCINSYLKLVQAERPTKQWKGVIQFYGRSSLPCWFETANHRLSFYPHPKLFDKYNVCYNTPRGRWVRAKLFSVQLSSPHAHVGTTDL